MNLFNEHISPDPARYHKLRRVRTADLNTDAKPSTVSDPVQGSVQ